MASCSGDKTVRFWDLFTETPLKTCEGHIHAVLIASWSPNGEYLATGDESGLIIIWDGKTCKQLSKCAGHKKFITGLSWEPLHKNVDSTRLASSSKDATFRIWEVLIGRSEHVTTYHSACVTKVLWGGQDMIYTTSEDRTIKVWSNKGSLLKDLKSHAHWVNCISINTIYALRTGCHDEKLTKYDTKEKMKEVALERYNKI